MLVHDAELLALLDAWVCSLPEREFTEVLPLLRRTFGAYERAERRSIGDAVTRRPTTATIALAPVDDALALPALRTATLLLGGPA